MKYKAFILSALAVLSIYSCQTTPETPDSKIVTFTAGFNGTRTAIDGTSGSVCWSAHERVLVFPSKYGQQIFEGKVFTSTNDAPQAVAEFVGTLPTADFEFTHYWAFYPYSTEAFANYEGVASVLPATQTGIPDTFPDDLNVAAAYSDDLSNVTFQHPMSGLRFSVQSSGITKVIIRSNEQYGINGLYQLEMDGSGVIYSTNGGQYEGPEGLEYTMTELIPQSGTLEPGHSYYIVLLPTSMTGGFTLLFERNDGKYAYRRVNNDVEFPRATFRTLMDADSGLEWIGGEPHLSEESVNLTEEASYFAVEAICPSGSYTVLTDCDWLREVAAEDDVISYGDAYNLHLGGDSRFQGYTHGFLAKANTGAARTGKVIFRKDGIDYPVTVTQEAGTLPYVDRNHIGFTMRMLNTGSSYNWQRDLLWETRDYVPSFNIAEGVSGSGGSDTYTAGKCLSWQYGGWGAFDGRVRLQGWNPRPTTSDIVAWMNESDEYYPARTSISVTSYNVNTESRLITTTVQVYAAKAGTYKLTGMLIEDAANTGMSVSAINSLNLVVGYLTDYAGETITIDTDGGTATLELSITAPPENHSTGNWGDLDQMHVLLYTQAKYGTQAKVRVTAPLNDSSWYIDNSLQVE